MAFITIYNPNQSEQQIYADLFSGTDHQYEFASEPINTKNLNPDTEVIAIFVTDKITRDIIEGLPKLQLIATQSTGYDHIDLQAAKDNDVSVVNVPAYGEQTVAEYTFALLLALSRKIPGGAHTVAHGITPNYDKICGFDLSRKTIGLIGTGRIGQHTARIAKGFGMEVIAYDLYPDQSIAGKIGFRYVELQDIARESDVISLHAPATPQTHHIVDSAFLAGVKSSAVLVNTARGDLVDSAALLTALQEGRLAGAGLDVVEHEDLLSNNLGTVVDSGGPQASDAKILMQLMRTPNVIITPHNGFNTHEARMRIKQTTVQNIIDFYKGKTPNKIEV